MEKRIFTPEHRKAISIACKGRKTWNKGKKASSEMVYRNMAAHLRFDIEWKWLARFDDVEKLKCLNDCITNRSGRFAVDTGWYREYIKKFYSDRQFNEIFSLWIGSKEKYLKPSIDHINPVSHGGTNEISNIQFLTWFENRCKNDMTQKEWDDLKNNIDQYLI